MNDLSQERLRAFSLPSVGKTKMCPNRILIGWLAGVGAQKGDEFGVSVSARNEETGCCRVIKLA